MVVTDATLLDGSPAVFPGDPGPFFDGTNYWYYWDLINVYQPTVDTITGAVSYTLSSTQIEWKNAFLVVQRDAATAYDLQLRAYTQWRRSL